MKKLYRHRNSDIAGICGGLGEYFDVDESIFRLLFLVGIFTPFPAILTYFLFWIVIPKEPKL